MKKNKFILAAILILATIFGFSCKQQADTEETMKFEAGWYIYTYTAGDLSNILFIKFDSEKTIIKMGNESKEFKGEGLEAYASAATLLDVIEKSLAVVVNVGRQSEPPVFLFFILSYTMPSKKVKTSLWTMWTRTSGPAV